MRSAILPLAVAALVAAAAGAEAQLAAQVIPSKHIVTARPGQPEARDILISNTSPVPIVVRLRLSDWTLTESGVMSLAAAGSTPRSLAGCIEFEPRDFSLAPGERGTIRATLSLPAEGPAARWGVLLSEVRPANVSASRLGPLAIAELGTTFYLSRAPALPVRAEFTAMEVLPLGTDSIAVSVRIENAGERPFYAGGEFTVVDSGGRPLAGGPLGYGVVLPEGARRFSWTSSFTLRPGRYLARATVDTGEPELMVGETWFDWSRTSPPLPLAQRHSR